jgi:hypothetical protein
MFLFKEYFMHLIAKGLKTQTRRLHKRARAKIGAVHQCRTKLFGEPFAYIKILRVWQEKLEDISQEDVYAEGLDMTPEEFIEGFMEIQPKALPDTMLWCYEFKVVKKGVSE